MVTYACPFPLLDNHVKAQRNQEARQIPPGVKRSCVLHGLVEGKEGFLDKILVTRKEKESALLCRKPQKIEQKKPDPASRRGLFQGSGGQNRWVFRVWKKPSVVVA